MILTPSIVTAARAGEITVKRKKQANISDFLINIPGISPFGDFTGKI
ncbi:MAG: hypothetical protein Kow00111_00100 [Thermincola ferriacetica]